MVIRDRLIVSHAASALDASTESPQRFQLKRVLFLLYIKRRALELSGRDRRLSLLPQRYFCIASTSLSPFPLENTGLSIVPPIRKGNCNLPSFNVAPDSRAMVLVKKLSLVVISANPR